MKLTVARQRTFTHYTARSIFALEKYLTKHPPLLRRHKHNLRTSHLRPQDESDAASQGQTRLLSAVRLHTFMKWRPVAMKTEARGGGSRRSDAKTEARKTARGHVFLREGRLQRGKQSHSQASPLALMGSLFLGAFLGFRIVVALKRN